MIHEHTHRNSYHIDVAFNINIVVYAFLKAGVEVTADSDGMELALGRWQLLWRALPLVPEPVRV